MIDKITARKLRRDYKVYCVRCNKFLGTKKGGRYNLIEGSYQQGNYAQQLVTYCSEKCQKTRIYILDKPNEIEIKKAQKEKGK